MNRSIFTSKFALMRQNWLCVFEPVVAAVVLRRLISEEKMIENKCVKEGSAVIRNVDNSAVFYNPVQQFNRDMSSAILKAYRQLCSKQEMNVFEGLSATGLRSIRYAKEVEGISTVWANDLDVRAFESIKLNAVENGVQEIVKPVLGDCNMSLLKVTNFKLYLIKLQGCNV